ncbi:TRAP transporter substrate-binding protein [Chthonobacter rhizosphaerae]|uniref:TRAP transporter substrate-binding protein n=1 Tax=Chthonobacter rhizosphaerae TaxID=2735553 RepID=UPI0015EE5F78|nr:TRAP transporter substrate-binding protein [Chthonobacter rhizosphaerae]
MFSRRHLLISSVAGVAALAMPHIARAAVRRFRLGTVSATNSAIGIASDSFAKALAEKSGGTLQVEVFHASAIGKAVDLVAGVKDSSIDMFSLAVDVLTDVPNTTKGLVTPFLFPSRDAARAAFAGKLGEFGLRSLSGTGIVGIGMYENGLRHVTARMPVRTPADLAGLKIRVPESPVSVATFKALGANPIPIPFAELVPKMKAGEVDAQENPITNIIAAKLEGMQTHVSLTGHTYSPGMFGLSEDVAAELTAAELAMFREAAVAGMKASHAESNQADASGLGFLKDNGWTIVDDVDVASFMKAAGTVHAACAEIVGADVLAEIKSLAA